jgi:hypothetical protein
VDVLRAMRERVRLTHDLVVKVVEPLSDDQLRWRPAPRAHCVGWTLWHLARVADAVQSDIRGRWPEGQLWESHGLASRWGIDAAVSGANGVGSVDIDDAAAARLPVPPKGELVDYARQSFGLLDEALAAVDAARFDEPRSSGYAVHARATTLSDYYFLALTHTNRHLGEIEYIRGLLGLSGTATR